MRLLALLIAFVSFAGEARVLTLNKARFAPYIRGTYGYNKLQRYAYQPGLPSTTTYGDSSDIFTQNSGEFGFSLMGSSLGLRLGVEVLSPTAIRNSTAQNASGSDIFGFDSEVYSVIPQANFEFILKDSASHRVYFNLGGGLAYTTLKNSIRPNAAGITALGTTDYVEEGTATNITYHGGVGFEFVLLDNISLATDIGYRYLRAVDFKSTRDSITYVGTVSKGDTIKNKNGTDRSVDLSGPFVGLTLRFYIF